MPHVFLSYVREDQEAVDRLATQLKRRGVDVWLDREQIKPGQRWQSAIATAIEEGAFFLACFSEAYEKRSRSYVHEELTLAIDELRRRPTDRAWFIPILLNKSSIPDRRIGGGETLRDIQWVDLHADWDEGLRKLTTVLAPAHLTPDQVLEKISLTSTLPSRFWDYLSDSIKNATKRRRDTSFVPIIGGGICPAVDLAIRDMMLAMARNNDYISQENVSMASMAEHLCRIYDPPFLKEKIANCLTDQQLPSCDAYLSLAELPIPLYITTNYDDLLMNALILAGKKPVREVCRWDDRTRSRRNTKPIEPTIEQPVIFHVLGQKDVPDSLVLSESDYRDFHFSLSSRECIPNSILAACVDSPLVFLGYLSDDNKLQEAIYNFHSSLPSRSVTRRPVCLQISPKAEIERLSSRVPGDVLISAAEAHFNEIISRFNSMNIRIFWGTADEFLAELATHLASRSDAVQ